MGDVKKLSKQDLIAEGDTALLVMTISKLLAERLEKSIKFCEEDRKELIRKAKFSGEYDKNTSEEYCTPIVFARTLQIESLKTLKSDTQNFFVGILTGNMDSGSGSWL